MRAIFLLLSLYFLQSCSHVFYQPNSHQYVNPTAFKLDYQDIYFDSMDGTKLHGWFFPAKGEVAKGTIVQFHGNAQNLSSHFFSLIWLVSEGYNLFTFDYRGYGKSEGTPNQKGIYLDALAALEKGDELNQEWGKGKLIIYGQSLGGAISLRAIPDSKVEPRMDLVVMDSTFSSYKEIAFNKLASRWFLLPISPLAFVLVSDEYSSKKVFDRIKRPTLVIVGEQDAIVPPKFGKEIYKGVASKKKWLWKVPNGAHTDVYHHGKGEFRQKFVDFLEMHTKK
jgi:fermentation-respiration switch protein FrsA (DUF1100 family)